MSDRTLTVVPSTGEGAPSAPPGGPHPMEVARTALREAAMREREPLRRALLRVADELPSRGRGEA